MAGKELEISKVVFTFEDGTTKELTGDELHNWEGILLMKSDYLLPGNKDHILASIYGGLVQGFVPPESLTKPAITVMK